MQRRGTWLSRVALAAAVMLAACGGGQQSNAAPKSGGGAASATAKATGQKIDPATTRTISGKVTVDGAVPENATIKMNADPVCAKETAGTPQTMETYVVGSDGKSLANVFVYVKD